jgi:glycosyltransferase involved in cell wall biosynthesis
MASGTVPLVTSEGGPREFVEDGVSGRLLPPREPARWAAAAADLLDDPSARSRMAERAVQVAAGFTDEAYAAAMLEHYTAVAKG